MTEPGHPHVRPLVIEFLGAPGAGKTSLRATATDACAAAGLTGSTVVAAARELASRTLIGRFARALPSGGQRSRVLWAIFRWSSSTAAVRHAAVTWPLVWRVLGSQRGRPAEADARDRRVLYWYLRLAGAHALFLRLARPGEVLVLDEGYVHRTVQLFASAVERPDPGEVTRYLEVVPVPDLLVVVRAPSEACAARVHDRGVWDRFMGQDHAVLERFVANAQRATEIAARYAIDQGWNVIEVANPPGALDASREVLRREVVARLVGVGAS
jgi:hypothetical protein